MSPSAAIRPRIAGIVFPQTRWIAKNCAKRAFGPDFKVVEQQSHQRHQNKVESVRSHDEHRNCAQDEKINIPSGTLFELLIWHRVVSHFERLPKVTGCKGSEGEPERRGMRELAVQLFTE